MRNLFYITLSFLFCLSAAKSEAAIIRVKHNATGSDNGTSWANAFTNLNTALFSAVAGDEIWVATGTYKPTTGTNVNSTFGMKSDVSVYGGFFGLESSRDARNWNLNPTILSGEIGGPTNTDNVKDLVLFLSVTNCILDGFYIQDAYTQLGVGTNGHGLEVKSGSDVTVAHCVIRNNTGYCSGALVSGGSFLVLDNCLFMNNWINGAGIVATASGDSGFLVRGCTFTQNHMAVNFARCISGHVGSDITVENSIIWGNDNPQPHFQGSTVSHSIVEGYAFEGLDNVIGFVYTLDPEFISPGTFDFKLKPQSCGVDPGWYLNPEQTYDLAHNAREQNGYLDLGCYESSTCSQPNDACSSAIFIELGAEPLLGSTKCATATSIVSNGCQVGNSYSSWYSFVAPPNGHVGISADFALAFPTIFGTNLNLRIGLYTGSCASISPVNCVNSGGPNESEYMDINSLIPGETYYVRVDGLTLQEGAFYISIEDLDPVCLGDFDGNGFINISDLLVFNSGYGCIGNCGVQDLDGNDLVNIADLLVFASLFGTTCFN
jgi:hypothetical protein